MNFYTELYIIRCVVSENIKLANLVWHEKDKIMMKVEARAEADNWIE
jgi:hypothetical protein